ncbi:MAG: creatininase family protein [Armatimonadetes bacterium]|nr:creatininase family protein [Armatimonadota bacterium]
MRYEYMKPEDYRRAKETAPIAYLPWGAHEWHGVHNPLGLDTLKAHALCLELCAETGGIVFPAVYCGFQTMKPYAGFDCTLEFSRELVQEHVRQYLAELAAEKFKVIVIVMGHYGGEHQKAIQEVVSEFNSNQHSTVAWAFPDYEPTKSEGFPGDHAGIGETSYMMYFYPQLVDLSKLPERELTTSEDGIMGNPRLASSKRGRDQTNIFVKNAALKIKELLQKSL